MFDIQTFSFQRSFQAEKVQEAAEDPAAKQLLDNISELASKVLGIFGKKLNSCLWQLYNETRSLEPLLASQSKNESRSDDDNTYLVSFKVKKNQTESPKQRMVVNNNFNGERLGSNQVFVESGPAARQPASHNIQLLKARRADPQAQTQTFQNLMQQFQQNQQRAQGWTFYSKCQLLFETFNFLAASWLKINEKFLKR